MTHLDLKAIKARLAAASSGEWDDFAPPGHPAIRCVRAVAKNKQGQRTTDFIADCQTTKAEVNLNNATFIANAPTDIAALVKEVESLRDMLEGADIELAMTLERLWQRSSGEQRKTISMNWPNWYLGALETGFYRKYYSATTLKPEQEAE